jgi:hypothetical protein
MNEQQDLFLFQGRSAFEVFKLLQKDKSHHHCHALHYLQMASELLGKASAWKKGPIRKSHKGLLRFLRGLSSNSKAQKRLGYDGKNDSWGRAVKKSCELAELVQNLAPKLAGDGPNPEYPWPHDLPTEAPAKHDFSIWKELTETAHGRAFIALLSKLFSIAEEYL